MDFANWSQLTHKEINLAIRVILGVDVVIICALTVYFYILNEMLAIRASRFGNITYHAFGTIFTGIAYGHPDCPPEIRKEYQALRRKFLNISIVFWIPIGLYLVFLRKYFH